MTTIELERAINTELDRIVLGGTFRLGYELGRWVEKHDRSKR